MVEKILYRPPPINPSPALPHVWQGATHHLERMGNSLAEHPIASLFTIAAVGTALYFAPAWVPTLVIAGGVGLIGYKVGLGRGLYQGNFKQEGLELFGEGLVDVVLLNGGILAGRAGAQTAIRFAPSLQRVAPNMTPARLGAAGSQLHWVDEIAVFFMWRDQTAE